MLLAMTVSFVLVAVVSLDKKALFLSATSILGDCSIPIFFCGVSIVDIKTSVKVAEFVMEAG